MVSTVQELSGLSKTLDRLDQRITEYRKILLDTSLGHSVLDDINQVAVTKGEVETVEALVVHLARRITGADPFASEWEPMHAYCSRHEAKKREWANQNYEYFGWSLIWTQKTRTYLEYLGGLHSAHGTPRCSQAMSSQAEIKFEPDAPYYHVALSFAGEDRAHAREIAELLRSSGFSVFFDEYEIATLWGRNLYTHLSEVYQNKAEYCLMFISQYYARKLWTKREREAAQARAFRESRDYILPLRLDDTVIPGLDEVVGYLDLRTTTYDQVVKCLAEKLKRS